MVIATFRGLSSGLGRNVEARGIMKGMGRSHVQTGQGWEIDGSEPDAAKFHRMYLDIIQTVLLLAPSGTWFVSHLS